MNVNLRDGCERLGCGDLQWMVFVNMETLEKICMNTRANLQTHTFFFFPLLSSCNPVLQINQISAMRIIDLANFQQTVLANRS